MVRYCCICKVESGAEKDVSIHTIPKSKDLKLKWFANIGRKVSKSSGVCNKHFKIKDFQYKVVGNLVKRFLVPGAVPTLLLTQSNRENILSNDTTLLSTKPSGETPILNSHNLLQANRDPNTILNITNTNLQDILNDSDKENINSTVIKDYSEIVNNNCYNKKTALKRKSDEPMKIAERVCIPRYIGNLQRQDFTSEISWKIFHNHVKKCKLQRRVLNQKVKRLNKKVETFKSLLDHLKENSLISSETYNALEVSY